ncbi:MAG TPA: hypothetical protein VGC66_08460 [Pyrinomonadaceae bacterium]|jgi:hypothetical protein
MQKFFIITVFALLSSITVAAQTASEQKPLADGQQVEFAKRVETGRTTSAPAAPIMSDKTKTSGERKKQTARIVDGRVLRLGPTTTYLKNGLSTEEVVRLLGKPTSVSERQEGNRLLAIYTFSRSEARVLIAEFENGLLTGSRTETIEAFETERSESVGVASF